MPSALANAAATAAAPTEITTAWRAKVTISWPFDPPVAFNTAKSRVFSSAETYTTEPMMQAAMSHRNISMNATTCWAWAKGLVMSALTWLSVRTRRAGVEPVGVPLVSTAETRA